MSSPVNLRVSILPANFILFALVIAKLMGWITWGWGWVLFPIWLPLAIFLGILSFAGSMMLGISFILAVATVIEKYLK